MNYLFDGKLYYLVFPDGIKFDVSRDLWERLKKQKEQGDL